MTETIFSPSFGNRPSYLVGRGSVISTFISGLEQEPGNRDRAMLMLGQRGSGKTVLLWELADRARKLGFVVATPTVASEDMLERIVEKIQEAGEPYVNKRRLPSSRAAAPVFSDSRQDSSSHETCRSPRAFSSNSRSLRAS